MLRSAHTEALLRLIADVATRRSVEALFDEMPALPGPPVAESMERAQFAVIKLVLEGAMRFDDVALLYRVDARDLWVSAGFGNDARAHLAWWANVATAAD